jgi:hypothetical protein
LRFSVKVKVSGVTGWPALGSLTLTREGVLNDV